MNQPNTKPESSPWRTAKAAAAPVTPPPVPDAELIVMDGPEAVLAEAEPQVNQSLLPRADNAVIWNSYRIKAEALKRTAETLTVTSVHDVAGQKIARTTRLELRQIRIAVDKARKDMVEGMTKEVSRINKSAKELKDFIEPLEERLQQQEDFIERETARLEDERRKTRSDEIRPFLQSVPSVDLGKISDEDYQAMLEDAKDLHALKLDRERKAEEARLKRETEEAEERERVRLENIRLKEEAEAREAELKAEREAAEKREREIAAKAEEERKAAAEVLRMEREAAESKAANERRVFAAQRREAEEKAEAERQAIAAERQKERAAAAENQRVADSLVREAKRQLDAERSESDRKKEEAYRAEKQRLADEAEAARKAASAPDREKLTAFADTLMNLKLPEVSEKADELMDKIRARLSALSASIKQAAEGL